MQSFPSETILKRFAPRDKALGLDWEDLIILETIPPVASSSWIHLCLAAVQVVTIDFRDLGKYDRTIENFTWKKWSRRGRGFFKSLGELCNICLTCA